MDDGTARLGNPTAPPGQAGLGPRPDAPAPITATSRGGSLIFLHIPKTAGTTLSVIIDRQFPRDAIFTIDGADIRGSVTQFIQLPETARARIQCLKGHMAFGLHPYLRSPSRYLTLLRHPVDRIVSHYHHTRGLVGHPFHDAIASGRMSLTDYVKSGIARDLSDGQTKLISGVFSGEPASGDLLALARQNLQEHFAAVGLAERFDESLILFKRLLGWRNVLYAPQNVSHDRPPLREVPRATVELIERQNALDAELYAFGQAELDRLIRVQGAGYAREVATFRRWNAVYARLWRGYQRCRSGARRGLQALGRPGPGTSASGSVERPPR